MIQTTNVTKIYKNGYQAVKGLNLHVAEGDIYGFLGPNGAGKTTTIRMLDGLLGATEGEIHVAGMDTYKSIGQIRRIIGVVPESHGYYYWMTAKEYLKYFAALFELTDVDDYIQELLERVGLKEKQDMCIGLFSRGMKQRLGIAKALVNKPKIIFLDEPTLGLDPKGQREIQELLLEINQKNKITIFITSHLLKDIEVLCNRVCIIKDGQIVAEGSIEELREKYMSDYIMLLKTNNDERARRLLISLPNVYSAVKTKKEKIKVQLLNGLGREEINGVKHQILQCMADEGIELEEMNRKVISMEDIFFRAIDSEVEKNEYE